VWEGAESKREQNSLHLLAPADTGGSMRVGAVGGWGEGAGQIHDVKSFGARGLNPFEHLLVLFASTPVYCAAAACFSYCCWITA